MNTFILKTQDTTWIILCSLDLFVICFTCFKCAIITKMKDIVPPYIHVLTIQEMNSRLSRFQKIPS